MQRIINDPNMVVEDYLKGYVKAHPDFIAPTKNPRVLKLKGAPIKGKVGIVTGGGSGHKPAFSGYIGKNLVDEELKELIDMDCYSVGMKQHG